ncbi:flagellar hook capping FlgD N-terminal domain-containing protein [Tumebacillus permanentifrigoris]|uniref:Flagellar basal-body rod modification protein FlgD n=1 Tax=Tumebacillus permanentifrigoris TaxID=378543 RepID=A0A316D902_9BACL|nr:flagellar hook capping FlgD N-terminal domain-containing protein [Tumebacillus permanentifrigoris]PWK12708.1 flagellar basal-body rod modification protein FlgD [Tumebacillus permanentifrigoris]
MADSGNISFDPSSYVRSTTAVKAPANKQLDRDAFLKILITQLQYQDPSQPMQDKEFIAQMAQFSALEQTSKVYQVNSLALGTQMIGNIAGYQMPDGSLKEGEVTSAQTIDGVVKVQIGNDMIDLNQILEVKKKQI